MQQAHKSLAPAVDELAMPGEEVTMHVACDAAVCS